MTSKQKELLTKADQFINEAGRTLVFTKHKGRRKGGRRYQPIPSKRWVSIERNYEP